MVVLKLEKKIKFSLKFKIIIVRNYYKSYYNIDSVFLNYDNQVYVEHTTYVCATVYVYYVYFLQIQRLDIIFQIKLAFYET